MKAILVVDMPECCAECPLMLWDAESEYYGACCPTLKEVNCVADSYKENEDKETKPNWCPLKPMPKKYIEHDITIETERDAAVCSHGITLGHNDVIEELEKSETNSDLSTDDGWWRDYMLYEMQND